MMTVAEQHQPIESAPKLPVSSEAVGELIRQIEARHDLLQHQVDGWCVWPLLRFPAALALMDLPFTKSSKESFTRRELLGMAAKDFLRLFFPRKSRYAVITLATALMEQEGALYRDVFFDDLLQELGSFFKIEKPNNKSFFYRSRNALLKSSMTTIAFELLSSLVLPKFRKPSRITNVAESLSRSLSREPGLEIFSAEKIGAMLEHFYWDKKLYSFLFRRVKPKYLFSADGYGDHAAFAAAKELGIKVCEFQHGSFMKGGPEYGWSSYAVSYRAKMPVPDQFFLFGDYWREQLEGDSFWEGHLSVVGNMRIDRYRKLKSDYRSASQKKNSYKIVLTSQGIDVEKMIAFASDFLKLAGDKLEIEFTIKLHPVYEADKSLYERAFSQNKRVRIISGSEAPSTFELLAAADLHLSISSSCHYDALGLGVPTVILPLANSDWIMPLHRAGHAFLATTPEDLLEIVSQLRGKGAPEAIGSYYFKPGAVENLQSALEA
jgi:hypothetical protein